MFHGFESSPVVGGGMELEQQAADHLSPSPILLRSDFLQAREASASENLSNSLSQLLSLLVKWEVLFRILSCQRKKAVFLSTNTYYITYSTGFVHYCNHFILYGYSN